MPSAKDPDAPKPMSTRRVLGRSISKSETLKAEQDARKGEGKRRP